MCGVVKDSFAVMKKFERRNLWFAVLVANLLYVSSGCTMTWPSPALHLLEKSPGLTASDEAWLGSIVAIGAMTGPLLYGLGIDWLGRRGTLAVNGGMFAVSWMALGLGRSSLAVLCFGRFVAGVGVGSALAAVPAYVTEIADDRYRQAMTSLTELFFGIGFLITYSVGPVVSYGWIAGADAVSTLVFLLLIPLIPESPYHQVAIGRLPKARQTLVWLRRTGNVDRELARIQREVRESRENHGSVLDLFRHRGPRRAFIFGVFMMCLEQLSAIDVVTNFAEPIFKRSGVSLSPTTCTLILGVLNVVAAAASTPFVAAFGAKPVLLASSAINGAGLLAFGIYKCLIDEGEADHSTIVHLIPLIALVTITGGYALGFGSIPWGILAELFPPPLKAVAVLSVSSIAWAADFLVLQAYGQVIGVTSSSSIFLFFGSSIMIGTVIMAILVPNTKGMTLAEINSIFDRKTKSDTEAVEPVKKQEKY